MCSSSVLVIAAVLCLFLVAGSEGQLSTQPPELGSGQDGACVSERTGNIFADGSSWRTEDGCTDCTCENGFSSCGAYKLRCDPCPLDYRPVPAHPKTCKCDTCQLPEVVHNCSDRAGASPSQQDRWLERRQGCRSCACIGGVKDCTPMPPLCPVLSCPPGRRSTPHPDPCRCDTCEPSVSTSRECTDSNGQKHAVNSDWDEPRGDKCFICGCDRGSRGAPQCVQWDQHCRADRACPTGHVRRPAKDACSCSTCDDLGAGQTCTDALGTVRVDGQRWFGSKCAACTCNKTQVTCVANSVRCRACPDGYATVSAGNLCHCPMCRKTAAEDEDRSCTDRKGGVHKHGTSYSVDSCEDCRCWNGTSSCVRVAYDPSRCDICPPGFLPEVSLKLEDKCKCHTCRRPGVNDCIHTNGRLQAEGTYHEVDGCAGHSCSGGMLWQGSSGVECNDCPQGFVAVPVYPPRLCSCPRCEKTAPLLTCMDENGVVRSHGQSWHRRWTAPLAAAPSGCIPCTCYNATIHCTAQPATQPTGCLQQCPGGYELHLDRLNQCDCPRCVKSPVAPASCFTYPFGVLAHGTRKWMLHADQCTRCACRDGSYQCDKGTCPRCPRGFVGVHTSSRTCCPACERSPGSCRHRDVVYKHFEYFLCDIASTGVCHCLQGVVTPYQLS